MGAPAVSALDKLGWIRLAYQMGMSIRMSAVDAEHAITVAESPELIRCPVISWIPIRRDAGDEEYKPPRISRLRFVSWASTIVGYYFGLNVERSITIGGTLSSQQHGS